MRPRVGNVPRAIAAVAGLLAVAVLFGLWSRPPLMSVGNLTAHPIAGAQNRIFISGTIGTDRRMTLVGADTPYGHADLAAASGCIGGYAPLPPWQIETGGGIDLAVGSGYLVVWTASGLPDEGSDLPVTLRFADAGSVTVEARVRSVDRDESLPRADASACPG